MKKHLRKIVVEQQEYIWSLEGNNLYDANDSLIVTLEGNNYSRLYINPFIHEFEVTLQNISLAIESAINLGWDPQNNSGDMKIELKNGKFVNVKAVRDH